MNKDIISIINISEIARDARMTAAYAHYLIRGERKNEKAKQRLFKVLRARLEKLNKVISIILN